MTSGPSAPVPFEAHIELIRTFLAQRDRIVDSIQGLLNARQEPATWRQDKAQLTRRFEDAFFHAEICGEQGVALRGQLQTAHWAEGFTPREMPGMHNDLPDPGEMMLRAFNLWRQTRWPGANGRVRHATALFNLYLLRTLELLVMRIWDAGPGEAAARLKQVQALLDALWASSPADQPVLIRDARWLIPTAQSPTTDELHPYFDVAEKLAGSLAEEDRLEVHRATIALAGGHLRSQLRYYHMQGTPLDEQSLVLSSRRSNALDFSMTLQGLVPLLDAYQRACGAQDRERRLALADAILQGLSADPELFVNRIDLLGPYTMIEPLFIAEQGDGASLTPMGRRHVELLREYERRIASAAPMLHEDCEAFRPLPGVYSPYGVMYGFSSNITEHMALKTLGDEKLPPFSLEDAFTQGTKGDGRLEWVSGWRRLPHVRKDVQQMYQYPQQFAEEIFARIAAALDRRVNNEVPVTGRLFVLSGNDAVAEAACADIPPMPLQYLLSSDLQAVAGYRARSCDEASLLHDRFEGEFMVSYRTPGGWIGLSKDFLTDVLGAGRNVKITGLPPQAVAVLGLMGLGLSEVDAAPA